MRQFILEAVQRIAQMDADHPQFQTVSLGQSIGDRLLQAQNIVGRGDGGSALIKHGPNLHDYRPKGHSGV